MIGIITDSTCDIPEDLLQKYGIIVVPILLTWGEEQYRDRVDMLPGEFYQRLAVDRRQPHTSMPSPVDFQIAYSSAVERGASEIIVLTVSGALSATYEVARTAAAQAGVPVTLVDSKGASMSLGWQVLAAARARDSGADMAGILKDVDRVRSRVALLVGLDTLEYLQRGGRIGGAIKWAGMLLKVKPLVSINHRTGLVEPVAISRTHDTLVELMYRKFFEQLNGGSKLRITVLHGNALQEALQLVDRIRSEYNPVELLFNITGPVLGINTGPGALALCGYAEE